MLHQQAKIQTFYYKYPNIKKVRTKKGGRYQGKQNKIK